MRDTRCSLVTLLASLGILAETAGCSFIFVKPPPSPEGHILTRSTPCTSSRLAPGVDTVITGLQVLRTALAATADDSVYADPKQPLSRGADVGLGVGFAALFLGSAVYGFVNTAECDSIHDPHEDQEPSVGDGEESPKHEQKDAGWYAPTKAGPAKGLAPPARPPDTRSATPIPVELEEDATPPPEGPALPPSKPVQPAPLSSASPPN